MSLRIEIVDSPAILRELARQRTVLDRIVTLLEGQRMALEDLQAKVARSLAALDNIAADIRRLKDRLAPGGLTAAEVAVLTADLEALAVRTEGVANDPENPDPAPVS